MRTLALLLALAATPIRAEEAVVMTFINQSSRVAAIVGVYERQDGRVIDDNLGSSDLFAPGETIELRTALIRCQPVLVIAWLGNPATEPDAEEIRGEADLCQNRTLILHD